MLFEAYGMTEIVTACFVNSKEHSSPHASGYPFDNCFAAILDETGKICYCGEGEILVSTNTMMLGYLKDPESTAQVFLDFEGKQWLKTGDIGMVDEDGYVYFKNSKIMDVTSAVYPVEEEYDLTGLYVSPGFIDMHTHGGGGNRFEGSVDDIVNGCNFHLAHGTTAICPTISAAEFDNMARSVRNVADAMEDKRVRGTILGVHMEGPYLSRKQAGAQCADSPGHPGPGQ